MRQRSRPPGSAFTLVEIVLSLGLIAFVLAGIFGLLSVAATSTTQSHRDTMVVAMSTKVCNALRATPFDELLGKGGLPVQPELAGERRDFSVQYFSAEGLRLPDENTPGAVYLCRVDLTVDPTTRGYGDLIENTLDAQLTFSWPISAPESKRQVQNIYAKIARY